MSRPPTPKAEPYKILAVDGADDDGGTMYYLYDADRLIAASAWPQPLERIAHITGHSTFTATWGGGQPDDED